MQAAAEYQNIFADYGRSHREFRRNGESGRIWKYTRVRQQLSETKRRLEATIYAAILRSRATDIRTHARRSRRLMKKRQTLARAISVQLIRIPLYWWIARDFGLLTGAR